MSRIYRKHYSGYSRSILAEFMSEKELNTLDKRYNEAKQIREIRMAENAIERLEAKHTLEMKRAQRAIKKLGKKS